MFDTPGFVCFHRIEAQGTSMFQDLLFGRRRRWHGAPASPC
jgi:hypothetical protein